MGTVTDVLQSPMQHPGNMKKRIKVQFNSLPRDTLEISRHATVDSILKDLKMCSRRVQRALDVFQTDYRVLERIYYKGKNQHRLALFWKRVAETRRYCERLVSVRIHDLVDDFRRSFFSSDGTDRSQNMKGVWTHVPTPPSMKTVSSAVDACSCLLTKMHDRLPAVYICLNLHLQNGAFLQLILTLIAVVSRLSAAVFELWGQVSTFQTILQRIGHLHNPDADHATPTTDENKLDGQFVERMSKAPPESGPAKTSPSPLDKAEPSRIVIERKRVQGPPSLKDPNTKRRRVRKDEIDDIFGFM